MLPYKDIIHLLTIFPTLCISYMSHLCCTWEFILLNLPHLFPPTPPSTIFLKIQRSFQNLSSMTGPERYYSHFLGQLSFLVTPCGAIARAAVFLITMLYLLPWLISPFLLTLRRQASISEIKCWCLDPCFMLCFVEKWG